MIETIDLTRRYREFTALDKLNLNIAKGRIFGFIGPNGAGKTTTIRIISGLLAASSGTVRVAGLDLTRSPRRARDVVGYLPDGFGAYPGMRVWEYLDFFGAAYRIPRKKRMSRLEEVLQLTGTSAMRDYFVDSLSRGMLQRVGLAKTLVPDPAVMLLDEPMSGLDPRARIEMRELLKTMRSLDKTVLVSSHILPELATFCDEIGILEQGRLLVCGSVEKVMKQVQQERVVDLQVLGKPEEAAAALRAKGSSVDVREVVGNLVRFAFEGTDDELSALLRELVSNGIPVLWQTEAGIDLEQIYLRVTEAAQAGARRAIT